MSGTQDRPVLIALRKQLTVMGQSEMDAVQHNEALKGMWDRLQELRQEMNEAKMEAAAAAAKPYLDLMAKIERDYAMLVKLSTGA